MKNKLVPKLRFPEFEKDDGWEEDELNQIGDFIGGGTPDTLIPEYWNGSIEWYTPTEIKNGVLSRSLRTITNEGLVNSSAKILPIGTILITTRATIGDVAITDKECTTNQGFQSLVVRQSQINKFWYYWIIKHKYELIRKASGSTFPEIGKSEISKIKALHPDKKEQQKIADCLSSLDDLISAETEKLAALKQHKKGLMQQLFPAEGEKLPKLRFPEFTDSGEWEEKKLGEVAKFINGKAYKQEELLDKGKYRVLRVGNFFTNKNWYYSDLELEGDKYCEDGDLLYAWSASFGPRVWRGEKVIYHYHIWKVLKNKAIDGDFLYILLDYETEKMKSQSNGFALLHITKSTIENWKCDIPVSINEQKKIAEFISYIDEQILEQTQKVDSLNCHKKGLMQGLFPKID